MTSAFLQGLGLGAVTASSLFFGPTCGAARLEPPFGRSSAWQTLDLLIGTVMWSVAVSLVRGALR